MVDIIYMDMGLLWCLWHREIIRLIFVVGDPWELGMIGLLELTLSYRTLESS